MMDNQVSGALVKPNNFETREISIGPFKSTRKWSYPKISRRFKSIYPHSYILTKSKTKSAIMSGFLDPQLALVNCYILSKIKTLNVLCRPGTFNVHASKVKEEKSILIDLFDSSYVYLNHTD